MKSWTAPGLDVIHSYPLHPVSRLRMDGNQLSGLVVQTDPGHDPRAGLLTSPPRGWVKIGEPKNGWS